MTTIKEGDKVRIHSASEKLYDNKVGKVLHVWDLDKNPWGNIVVKIESDNFQNCFLEEELELLKEITMEQNLKELLLKDLCARLPYGVMVLEDIDKTFDGGCVSRLTTITEIKGEKMFLTKNSLTPVTIEEIRPYLRPMSSMTEEEYEEYTELRQNISDKLKDWKCADLIDWLNKKMFAYRTINGKDMFKLGIALRAPEGMYNINNK